MDARFDNRIVGLDALRGIAAMCVLFCHVILLGDFPSPPFAKYVAAEFTLAVPMFFALSAFALAHVYFGRLNSGEQIKDYAIRRFFRIAPLFYFVGMLWYVWRWAHGIGYPDALSYWLTVTFTFGLSHFFGLSQVYADSFVGVGWSIGIEMVFYATLPLVFVLVRDFRAATLLTISTFIIGYLFDQTLSLPSSDPVRRMTFVSQAANFSAGLMAYFAYLHVVQLGAKPRQRMSAGLLVIVGTIWIFAYFISDHVGDLNADYHFATSYVGRYIVSSAFPFLILAVAIWDWSLLVNRVTKTLGELSYSIYLLHCLVIMEGIEVRKWIYSLFPGSWWEPLLLTIFIVSVTTIVLSALTFATVEKGGQWLGRKIAAIDVRQTVKSYLVQLSSLYTRDASDRWQISRSRG